MTIVLIMVINNMITFALRLSPPPSNHILFDDIQADNDNNTQRYDSDCAMISTPPPPVGNYIGFGIFPLDGRRRVLKRSVRNVSFG